MSKRLKVKESVLVEEGVYNAELKSIKEKEGKWGPYYTFSFAIKDEGEFTGKIVTGMCPGEIAVGNKTYNWASALLGNTLEIDEEVDLDELIGRQCQIVVVINEDKTFANVDKVWKSKKTKKEEKKQEVKEDEVKEDEEEEDPKPKKKIVKDDDEFE